MVWLGLVFDTVAMTVTLPPKKLKEVLDLVTSWDSLQLFMSFRYFGEHFCMWLKFVHQLGCF